MRSFFFPREMIDDEMVAFQYEGALRQRQNYHVPFVLATLRQSIVSGSLTSVP